MAARIQLQGRIFLTFDVQTKTGLHIGGSDEGIGIGGVDKTVIRDPLSNYPYIPGSSLRGKLRSLSEKYSGAVQNNNMGGVTIHTCESQADYNACDICHIFGVPGEKEFSSPSRLIVRDIHLTEESAADLNNIRTDLPYTELKTEVAIDRVTSAANPRQMERVPAGARFGKAEMIYSIYSGDGFNQTADLKRFEAIITGLQLLEDDYLGGLGSRGSGRVVLKDIQVTVKSRKEYKKPKNIGHYADLPALITNLENVKKGFEATFAN